LEIDLSKRVPKFDQSRFSIVLDMEYLNGVFLQKARDRESNSRVELVHNDTWFRGWTQSCSLKIYLV